MTDPIAYYREYRPMMDNQQVKELFSDFSFDQLLDVWRSLSDDEATDIFLHLSPEVKLDLITELEIEDQEKSSASFPLRENVVFSKQWSRTTLSILFSR